MLPVVVHEADELSYPGVLLLHVLVGLVSVDQHQHLVGEFVNLFLEVDVGVLDLPQFWVKGVDEALPLPHREDVGGQGPCDDVVEVSLVLTANTADDRNVI
jgi:hypothetical protein